MHRHRGRYRKVRQTVQTGGGGSKGAAVAPSAPEIKQAPVHEPLTYDPAQQPGGWFQPGLNTPAAQGLKPLSIRYGKQLDLRKENTKHAPINFNGATIAPNDLEEERKKLPSLNQVVRANAHEALVDWLQRVGALSETEGEQELRKVISAETFDADVLIGIAKGNLIPFARHVLEDAERLYASSSLTAITSFNAVEMLQVLRTVVIAAVIFEDGTQTEEGRARWCTQEGLNTLVALATEHTFRKDKISDVGTFLAAFADSFQFAIEKADQTRIIKSPEAMQRVETMAYGLLMLNQAVRLEADSDTTCVSPANMLRWISENPFALYQGIKTAVQPGLPTTLAQAFLPTTVADLMGLPKPVRDENGPSLLLQKTLQESPTLRLPRLLDISRQEWPAVINPNRRKAMLLNQTDFQHSDAYAPAFPGLPSDYMQYVGTGIGMVQRFMAQGERLTSAITKAFDFSKQMAIVTEWYQRYHNMDRIMNATPIPYSAGLGQKTFFKARGWLFPNDGWDIPVPLREVLMDDNISPLFKAAFQQGKLQYSTNQESKFVKEWAAENKDIQQKPLAGKAERDSTLMWNLGTMAATAVLPGGATIPKGIAMGVLGAKTASDYTTEGIGKWTWDFVTNHIAGEAKNFGACYAESLSLLAGVGANLAIAYMLGTAMDYAGASKMRMPTLFKLSTMGMPYVFDYMTHYMWGETHGPMFLTNTLTSAILNWLSSPANIATTWFTAPSNTIHYTWKAAKVGTGFGGTSYQCRTTVLTTTSQAMLFMGILALFVQKRKSLFQILALDQPYVQLLLSALPSCISRYIQKCGTRLEAKEKEEQRQQLNAISEAIVLQGHQFTAVLAKLDDVTTKQGHPPRVEIIEHEVKNLIGARAQISARFPADYAPADAGLRSCDQREFSLDDWEHWKDGMGRTRMAILCAYLLWVDKYATSGLICDNYNEPWDWTVIYVHTIRQACTIQESASRRGNLERDLEQEDEWKHQLVDCMWSARTRFAPPTAPLFDYERGAREYLALKTALFERPMGFDTCSAIWIPMNETCAPMTDPNTKTIVLKKALWYELHHGLKSAALEELIDMPPKGAKSSKSSSAQRESKAEAQRPHPVVVSWSKTFCKGDFDVAISENATGDKDIQQQIANVWTGIGIKSVRRKNKQWSEYSERIEKSIRLSGGFRPDNKESDTKSETDWTYAKRRRLADAHIVCALVLGFDPEKLYYFCKKRWYLGGLYTEDEEEQGKHIQLRVFTNDIPVSVFKPDTDPNNNLHRKVLQVVRQWDTIRLRVSPVNDVDTDELSIASDESEYEQDGFLASDTEDVKGDDGEPYDVRDRYDEIRRNLKDKMTAGSSLSFNYYDTIPFQLGPKRGPFQIKWQKRHLRDPNVFQAAINFIYQHDTLNEPSGALFVKMVRRGDAVLGESALQFATGNDETYDRQIAKLSLLCNAMSLHERRYIAHTAIGYFFMSQGTSDAELAVLQSTDLGTSPFIRAACIHAVGNRISDERTLYVHLDKLMIRESEQPPGFPNPTPAQEEYLKSVANPYGNNVDLIQLVPDLPSVKYVKFPNPKEASGLDLLQPQKLRKKVAPMWVDAPEVKVVSGNAPVPASAPVPVPVPEEAKQSNEMEDAASAMVSLSSSPARTTTQETAEPQNKIFKIGFYRVVDLTAKPVQISDLDWGNLVSSVFPNTGAFLKGTERYHSQSTWKTLAKSMNSIWNDNSTWRIFGDGGNPKIRDADELTQTIFAQTVAVMALICQFSPAHLEAELKSDSNWAKHIGDGLKNMSFLAFLRPVRQLPKFTNYVFPVNKPVEAAAEPEQPETSAQEEPENGKEVIVLDDDEEAPPSSVLQVDVTCDTVEQDVEVFHRTMQIAFSRCDFHDWDNQTFESKELQWNRVVRRAGQYVFAGKNNKYGKYNDAVLLGSEPWIDLKGRNNAKYIAELAHTIVAVAVAIGMPKEPIIATIENHKGTWPRFACLRLKHDGGFDLLWCVSRANPVRFDGVFAPFQKQLKVLEKGHAAVHRSPKNHVVDLTTPYADHSKMEAEMHALIALQAEKLRAQQEQVDADAKLAAELAATDKAAKEAEDRANDAAIADLLKQAKMNEEEIKQVLDARNTAEKPEAKKQAKKKRRSDKSVPSHPPPSAPSFAQPIGTQVPNSQPSTRKKDRSSVSMWDAYDDEIVKHSVDNLFPDRKRELQGKRNIDMFPMWKYLATSRVISRIMRLERFLERFRNSAKSYAFFTPTVQKKFGAQMSRVFEETPDMSSEMDMINWDPNGSMLSALAHHPLLPIDILVIVCDGKDDYDNKVTLFLDAFLTQTGQQQKLQSDDQQTLSSGPRRRKDEFIQIAVVLANNDKLANRVQVIKHGDFPELVIVQYAPTKDQMDDSVRWDKFASIIAEMCAIVRTVSHLNHFHQLVYDHIKTGKVEENSPTHFMNALVQMQATVLNKQANEQNPSA